ncbi:MAG: HEAT repeat domain-containing protein [Planctomycetes bacterium]|nr:HEAT repeat domain-containing protein [Planctomycetota bacterium]
MRYIWLLSLAGCFDVGLYDPWRPIHEAEVDRIRRVDRYVERLTHPSAQVRDEAFRGLVGMGPEAVEPLLTAATYGDAPRASAALLVLEARREPGLAPTLVLRWPKMIGAANRAATADLLGRSGDASVVPDLARFLDLDASALVRSRLCAALGILGGAHGIDALGRAARDPAALVSLPAIRALGQVGRSEAAGPLLDAWRRHGDAPRRLACADAFGRLRARSAVEDLIAGLDSDSHEVRAACASALGLIADRRAVRRLVDALGDPSIEVFQEADRALRRITGRTPAVVPGPRETLRERTKKAWEKILG